MNQPIIIKATSENLLMPPKDHCQECAVKHRPDFPHNRDTLFYQVKFKIDNDREATWYDAVAHCPDHIKKAWLDELKLRNII